MLRLLIKVVALRHNRMLPRREGERGIDHLRRDLVRRNRLVARRTRRLRGQFPWWGMGRLWWWLYRPYNEHMRREDEKHMKSLGVNDFVRESLWRQGIERKIMPVCPIPPDML